MQELIKNDVMTYRYLRGDQVFGGSQTSNYVKKQSLNSVKPKRQLSVELNYANKSFDDASCVTNNVVVR